MVDTATVDRGMAGRGMVAAVTGSFRWLRRRICVYRSWRAEDLLSSGRHGRLLDRRWLHSFAGGARGPGWALLASTCGRGWSKTAVGQRNPIRFDACGEGAAAVPYRLPAGPTGGGCAVPGRAVQRALGPIRGRGFGVTNRRPHAGVIRQSQPRKGEHVAPRVPHDSTHTTKGADVKRAIEQTFAGVDEVGVSPPSPALVTKPSGLEMHTGLCVGQWPRTLSTAVTPT